MSIISIAPKFQVYMTKVGTTAFYCEGVYHQLRPSDVTKLIRVLLDNRERVSKGLHHPSCMLMHSDSTEDSAFFIIVESSLTEDLSFERYYAGECRRIVLTEDRIMELLKFLFAVVEGTQAPRGVKRVMHTTIIEPEPSWGGYEGFFDDSYDESEDEDGDYDDEY